MEDIPVRGPIEELRSYEFEELRSYEFEELRSYEYHIEELRSYEYQINIPLASLAG